MAPSNINQDRTGGSVSAERIFTGFEQPFLHSVAKDLIGRYSSETFIDLSTATVVVSGTRVGRRLMELLVIESNLSGDGRGIVPPKIITRGSLLESFMSPSSATASEVSRYLAWMTAIKTLSPEGLSRLSLGDTDEQIERSASALAKRIDTVYGQLNGEGLRFIDVATRGQEIESFDEEQRWEALEELHQLYVQELSRVALVCPYQRRIDYLQNGPEITNGGDIFLCGILEFTRQQQDFLSAFSGTIFSYVFADQCDEPGFDAVGAIRPNYWEKKQIPLQDEHIEVVQHPRDIAPAAVACFSGTASQVCTDDSIIGLGNEDLGAFIKAGLQRLGVPAREAAGTSPQHTELAFTISALLAYIETRSLEALSSLIRTPLVHAYLLKNLEMDSRDRQLFVDAVDRYQSEHLQDSTRGSLPLQSSSAGIGLAVTRCVDSLILPLTEPQANISVWAGRLYDVLEKILTDSANDPKEILDTVNALISEFSNCPLSHQLQGSEMLAMFSEQFESRLEVPDNTANALELLGWLEVASDDSSSVVLTGIEEGIVPAVINADPFVPDTLARHLGLPNNSSRYARDAALLAAIVGSKPTLRVIVSRRNLAGEMTEPSRLLLTCEESKLASRIQRLRGHSARYEKSQVRRNERKQFSVNSPEPPLKKIEKMSATSFGAYLWCPYEFYLSRIARVEPVSDRVVELDGLGFGNLAHDVLSWAAKQNAFNDTSEKVIRALLYDGLEDKSREYFGTHPLPAVAIQVEHLRRRFGRLASWQSEHRKQGWLTIDEERSVSDELVSLPLSDGTMMVTGRIDRVDRMQDSERYLIVDYKTGEKPRTKQSVCAIQGRKDDEDRYTLWKDFQAPLYVHAAGALYPKASAIEFGFINISASLDEDVYTPISIDQEEMKDAIEQATEIAQCVSDGIFWPPNHASRRYSEEDPYWRLLASVAVETAEDIDA